MKKILLCLACGSIVGLAISSSAQIVFDDNSHDAYDTTINGVANVTQDLNLELLYGTSPDSFSSTPVVTLLLNSPNTSPDGSGLGQTLSAAGDISGRGTIDDLSGIDYSLGSAIGGQTGQTIYLEVLAWTGDYSSYQAALACGNPGVDTGISQVFTADPGQGKDSGRFDVNRIGIIDLRCDRPPLSGGGGNVIAPEPSPILMAATGVGSMLVFGTVSHLRRRDTREV